MRIKDIFETRIEEKIEPVIKVGETQDEAKLASEIGAYVVTPTIEKYVDEFLEHYTDTIRLATTEVGVWISGYFGSGKSHLAKILALLAENRTLKGTAAVKRFEARVPKAAPHSGSIARSLGRVAQADTRVLAFNLNTLVDSKTTPLPRLLLSQYYRARGYSANLFFARVIEQELDRRGKLGAFHDEVGKRAGKPWHEISGNPGFYQKHLYAAASAVAPDAFATPEEVASAIKVGGEGDLYNTQLLVQTLLDDLAAREQALKKPCRMLLVLDESGQWIEDSADRLSMLQALVEEAAIRGQGKLWVFVTTHEDMGAIYQNARALKGDMKKIEGRFRFRFSLTTENIELVLEDRIFKKKIAGRDAVALAYDAAPGVLRGLGELAHVAHTLPACEKDRFVTFYPFFPYQIHLIPEIVKSLRSKGGRGEQLSGSTRTLLAIAQDILRMGRRHYLDAEVGEMVSFDEVYANLAGEAEVSPDVRRELGRIEEVVPGATAWTRRVAEVLFLIDEIKYVPRTVDNLARLLVESASDDLTPLVARVQPELDRLIAAKMVARIGDDYEFLTGERRTFEDEVAQRTGFRQQDREAGLAKHFVHDPERKANHLRQVLDFDSVAYKGVEFPVKISMDGTYVGRSGDIEVRIYSPLEALAGRKVSELEDASLAPNEQNTLFVLCDRLLDFDKDLDRFLAMREVVSAWKGDSNRSEEARKLAAERESVDLEKLGRKVRESIKTSLRQGHVIFRGSSHALSARTGQTPGEALQAELANYWPTLYPKLDKVPFRIEQEGRAILDVLNGEKNLSLEVRALKLFDAAGALDPHAPLVDALRIFLATRQNRKERTLGKDLLDAFRGPPYGWDPNAVRVGVAACVRAALVKVLVGKMPHTNPADPTLQNALRVSREFDKVELVLEDAVLAPDELEDARAALIKLTGKRKIDETPAALHEAMEAFGREVVARAEKLQEWSSPARFPLPTVFGEAKDAFDEVLALTNPVHRVKALCTRAEDLQRGAKGIEALASFREKWGKAFTEMRDFAEELEAIEHLLPAPSPMKSFLGEHRSAKAGARFGDPEVWKALQGAKADADIGLSGQLSAWRDEARQKVEDAVERLPEGLKFRFLGDELAKGLAAPLDAFLGALDHETKASRVAALPERARQLVRALGEAIEAEVDRRPPAPKAEAGGTGATGGAEVSVVAPYAPPAAAARPRKRLRVADVVPVRRIRNEAEWDEVKQRLDEQVRVLLRDFDVELE